MIADSEWYAMGFDPTDPADWAAMSAAEKELMLYYAEELPWPTRT